MLRSVLCRAVTAGVRRVAIPVAVIVCLAGGAYAMRVSPMVIEMTTTGVGATARVEVDNNDSSTLPFETRITRIDYDDKGNATETPADGDFLVFPPQGLLPQGARQVIRLQWVGDTDLPASRGYYLSVNQIPVALSPAEAAAAGAQVRIVYHMKVLVTVAPPNATPKITVTSAVPTMIKPQPAPGGAAAIGPSVPGVAVTVRNTGNRYAMMAGDKWIIEGTGTDGKPLSVTLTTDDLDHAIGVGYLAPLKGQRTFDVPTGQTFGPGPIKVKFVQ